MDSACGAGFGCDGCRFLSIPLNGFQTTMLLHATPSLLLLSFNSIEWIPGGRAGGLEGQGEDLAFNSIEWILNTWVNVAYRFSLTFNSIEWIPTSVQYIQSPHIQHVSFNSIEWILEPYGWTLWLGAPKHLSIPLNGFSTAVPRHASREGRLSIPLNGFPSSCSSGYSF